MNRKCHYKLKDIELYVCEFLFDYDGAFQITFTSSINKAGVYDYVDFVTLEMLKTLFKNIERIECDQDE